MRPMVNTEHGQYAFAKRTKCDCRDCYLVVSRYDKQRRLDMARGIEKQVDAGPAREHIQMLTQAGVSWRSIAQVAGLSRDQIRFIGTVNRKGEVVEKIYPKTEAAILSVDWEPAYYHGKMPAIGVKRRLRALLYMGHTFGEVAAELNMSETQINKYHRTSGNLMAATVLKVDGVYRRLGMIPGTCTRNRFLAYRNDWAPPMAWDDVLIDDPAAKPDMSSVVCCVGNCDRPAVHHTLCRRHGYEVRDAGGYEDSEKFYDTVQRISRDQKTSYRRLLADLEDLREQGVTSALEAAMRLGRPLSYIEKVWGLSA